MPKNRRIIDRLHFPHSWDWRRCTPTIDRLLSLDSVHTKICFIIGALFRISVTDFPRFLFWWISGLNGKFRGYQSYLRIFGGFRAFRIILSLFAFAVESRPHHRVNLYNHTWSPISVPASIKKDKLFGALFLAAKPNDCFLLFTLLCQSWIYPARWPGGQVARRTLGCLLFEKMVAASKGCVVFWSESKILRFWPTTSCYPVTRSLICQFLFSK